MNEQLTPTPDTTLVRSHVLRRFPTSAPLAIGALLVLSIAGLDRLTGPTVSVELLHAVAIIAVTWLGSRRNGLLVSTLAATSSVGAAVWAEGGLAIAAVWNGLTRLGVLIVVTLLVARLRDSSSNSATSRHTTP